MNHHEVVKVVSGESLSKAHKAYKGVGTDTRKDLKGQLFVALRGESYDPHEFLHKAVEAGASGLLVDQWPEACDPLLKKVSVIKVDDTLKGLQDLANAWRRKLKAKVLALSGSNGKTTSKEFAAQILSQKFETTMSPGSFNNHWGVPLSLFQASLDDEVVVLEMGMNHKGELTRLCAIAEPDVVMVTNVGRAHIGEVGSQQGVAEAKQEMYLSCPEALHIYNIDNEFTIRMYEERIKSHPNCPILTFSGFRQSDGPEVYLRSTSMNLLGMDVQGVIGGVEGQCRVPVFGRHNVSNLMAAASLALAAGMKGEEIWKALPLCRTSWGRNQVVETQLGFTVVFDAYNANPESMGAMVRNLMELASEGKLVLVLADMLELGEDAEKLHEELGALVGQAGADTVWFIGNYGASFERGMKSSGFDNKLIITRAYEEKLAKDIGSMLSESDLAVIKGSRGLELERVVHAWNPTNF